MTERTEDLRLKLNSVHEIQYSKGNIAGNITKIQHISKKSLQYAISGPTAL